MADPRLVLLVVLAGPPGGDPMDGAVVGSAVRDALGDETRVLVDDRQADFPDGEAAAAATRLRADAVASIAWSDAAANRAHVHMFVTADGVFYDRDLVFQPADAIVERERAVGLLIGAMVRAAREEAPPAPPAPSPVRPPPVAPPRDVAMQGARPLPSPAPRPFAVEGGATASTGLGGAALGLGPHLRGAWYPTRALALRAGGAALLGTIAQADATTATYRLTAGLAWRAVSFGSSGRGSLEIGANAAVINHRVTRGEPSLTRDRWVTGAQVGARLGYRASPMLEPFLGVAAELVAGSSPVVVGDRTAAEIPPLRLLGEAGVALRF